MGASAVAFLNRGMRPFGRARELEFRFDAKVQRPSRLVLAWPRQASPRPMSSLAAVSGAAFDSPALAGRLAR
jgi:hypothetical protein